ncbi:hypothetical protein UYO_2824 [Lachnospiraceae bacterium JC7]|nr:hypothetical protein UYO_2824 [Lachnospiraceae bacterium JC7]
MSVKKLDQKGRWRNVIVAFRVSHEEDVRIDREVHLSGLSKQDFILRRLLNNEVVIQGNPKVYKALKDELKEVMQELKRIEAGKEVDPELLRIIKHIADILEGMKKDDDWKK